MSAEPQAAQPEHLSRARRGRAGRGRIFKVRLNDAEYDELMTRARRAGLSGARYLVSAGLERPETVNERRLWVAEVGRAERVMRGVATNVNQLAKVANSTGRVPAGTADALVSVRAACAAVVAMAAASGYQPEDAQ